MSLTKQMRIMIFVTIAVALGAVCFIFGKQFSASQLAVKSCRSSLENKNVSASKSEDVLQNLNNPVPQPIAPKQKIETQKENARETGGKRSSWAQLQSKVKNSVVQIICQSIEYNFIQSYKTPEVAQGLGSGFFISSDGYIITNAHVVNQAKSIWIRMPILGKKIIDAHVVCIAPERDLALLKVTPASLEKIKETLGEVMYLPLGDSDNVFRGDKVMALGYPMGSIGSVALKGTTGIVSGREPIDGQYLIQMDSAISPGSSGGGVINNKGEVIGISIGSSAHPHAQNVNFIIPSNELKIILPDMYHEDDAKTKLLRRLFLGILYHNGSDKLCELHGNPKPAGCFVVDVYKGSPLERAGIKGGDMIYQVDGYDVDFSGDMLVPWYEDKLSVTNYISRLRFGDEISMVAYRQGERKEFTVKLEETKLLPIRLVFPAYEKMDYENFGFVVMPLTLNHLPIFASIFPTLTRYTRMKDQIEPALIITYVHPNSQTNRDLTIAPGMIIDEINNEKAKTLEDFRRIIKENLHKRYLEIKVTDGATVVLDFQDMITEWPQLAANYNFPITPFAYECLDTLTKKQEK